MQMKKENRLHIGDGTTVRESGVVGIFDLDEASSAETTRDYLRRAEKEGTLLNEAGAEIPRSFVLVSPPMKLSRGGKTKTAVTDTATVLALVSSRALTGRDKQ